MIVDSCDFKTPHSFIRTEDQICGNDGEGPWLLEHRFTLELGSEDYELSYTEAPSNVLPEGLYTGTGLGVLDF